MKDWERSIQFYTKMLTLCPLVVDHMWSRMFGDFLIGAVVFVGLGK